MFTSISVKAQIGKTQTSFIKLSGSRKYAYPRGFFQFDPRPPGFSFQGGGGGLHGAPSSPWNFQCFLPGSSYALEFPYP